MASYIEEEIRKEITEEYGSDTILDKELTRISTALARAIRKYLLKDVLTYQTLTGIKPTTLAGGGPAPIVPNPHIHFSDPHAHRINAP